MPPESVVAALVGGLSVLFDMADHAYLPTLIARSQIVDGNAKLAATESIAEIGGPSLAGVLFQALTAPFAAGLARLRADGGERRCAVMCAEAVWWRCHRRIIADYLLAAGDRVMHILGASHVEEARLTPGAVVRPDGTVIYPAAARPA